MNQRAIIIRLLCQLIQMRASPTNKGCGICDSFYWLIDPFAFTTSSQLGIRKHKSDLWKSRVLLYIGYLPISSFPSRLSALFPSTNVSLFQPIEDGHGYS